MYFSGPLGVPWCNFVFPSFAFHFIYFHILYYPNSSTIHKLMHYPIIAPLHGSHGLNAERTKPRRPEGLKELPPRSGTQRAPDLS